MYVYIPVKTNENSYKMEQRKQLGILNYEVFNTKEAIQGHMTVDYNQM